MMRVKQMGLALFAASLVAACADSASDPTAAPQVSQFASSAAPILQLYGASGAIFYTTPLPPPPVTSAWTEADKNRARQALFSGASAAKARNANSSKMFEAITKASRFWENGQKHEATSVLQAAFPEFSRSEVEGMMSFYFKGKEVARVQRSPALSLMTRRTSGHDRVLVGDDGIVPFTGGPLSEQCYEETCNPDPCTTCEPTQQDIDAASAMVTAATQEVDAIIAGLDFNIWDYADDGTPLTGDHSMAQACEGERRTLRIAIGAFLAAVAFYFEDLYRRDFRGAIRDAAAVGFTLAGIDVARWYYNYCLNNQGG